MTLSTQERDWILSDPPEPPPVVLRPSDVLPPLVAIDVHPEGSSGRRWVFEFEEGLSISTNDPDHAQMISQQVMPAGPLKSNTR